MNITDFQNSMKDGYAQFEAYPTLSRNIISNLIDNPKAEIIWKCLKYDNEKSWQMPNLTKEEKRALIYEAGSPTTTNYRVFQTRLQDDAISEQQTQLRIFPMGIKPLSKSVGVCGVCFQVFSHLMISPLSNNTVKDDVMIQALLASLNGEFVGGAGQLFFDNNSQLCSVREVGYAPFVGKQLTMAVNIG